MTKRIFSAGVLATLLCTTSAEASVVNLSNPGGAGSDTRNALGYRADPGEANAVTFTQTSTTLTVVDTGAIIRPGSNAAECQISEDRHRATCIDAAGFSQLDARLGDLDDTGTSELTASSPDASFSTVIGGGPGADTLTGSDVSGDNLAGGSGDDRLMGRGGGDQLSDFDFSGDFASSSGGTNVMLGGGGNDLFFSGPGDDRLEGEAGNDQLVSFGGRDRVSGGDGQDFMNRNGTVGRAATDGASFDGGPGEDGVLYSLGRDFQTGQEVTPDSPGATVRLDADGPTTGNGLPGQDDTLARVENAFGSFGRDALTGSAGPNRLSGSAGNDTIAGGAGLDVIDGGTDRDSIDARDGRTDRVRCGDGAGGDPGDTAQVDEADDVDRCPAAGSGTTVTPAPPAPRPAPEVVRVPVPGPPAPAPAADTTRPDLSATSLPRSIRLRTLRGRGYRFTLRTTELAPASLEAQLLGRPRGRVRISRAGDVVLAQRTGRLDRTTAVTLRPARALRAGLRRGSRLRVTVRVADAAGNVATRTVSVRVR